MDTKHTCQHCGKALGPDAIEGLCPECLMKMGLGIGTEATAAGSKRPFVPPAPAELAPKFPQLEIVALIGQGGMGAVYRARQKQLDRVVALKILPPGSGGDEPAFAERFAREARAMARLNHPGIVTIHDFGQTDGLFYFVMEFVDGVSLRQLLHTGRISPREALAIVPQICDALQYAHDQGIVHRDIKPENVLLDRQGRVKVADFGLAKLVGAEVLTPAPSHALGKEGPIPPAAAPGPAANLTDASKVLGTPQYMAPEQVDHPGDVDHRADIYALGVVFYQMLTGELPGQRVIPPSKRVQVDVRLDEVVLRALEKEPERRYQQVSEVKTAIATIAENVLAAPPEISAAKPATPARGLRNRRLRFALWVLAALWVLDFAFVHRFALDTSGLHTIAIGVLDPWLANIPYIQADGSVVRPTGIHFNALSFLSGLLALAVGVLLLWTRPNRAAQTGPVGSARPRPRWLRWVWLPAGSLALVPLVLAISFWKHEQGVMRDIKAEKEWVATHVATGIDLLRRYPTTSSAGDLAEAHARSWEFTPADIFRISRFQFAVGREFRVETGPADVGFGHWADGVLWALLIPREPGQLTSRVVAKPESISQVWLRFHPKRLNQVFPPRTVSAGGATNLAAQMLFIANLKLDPKLGSSFISFPQGYDGPVRLLLPEPKDMTVDVDLQEGSRRFFMVDTEAQTAQRETQEWYQSVHRQAGTNPAASGAGTASPRLQERGQAILKQLIETNRYWLWAPPHTVTNYAYIFHYYDWAARNYGQTPVRVVSPKRVTRARRQGFTYNSLLHFVALNPARIQIRNLAEQNGRITLDLGVGPAPPGQTNEAGRPLQDPWPGFMRKSQDPDHDFAGMCGNGIEGTLYGGFGFVSSGGRLVIDAGKMVPLKSVARIVESEATVDETFDNYTEVVPGHSAPLSVRVVNGPMEFQVSFKVHPGGLWLFDHSQYQDKKSASVDEVTINQPGLRNLTEKLGALAEGLKADYLAAHAALFERNDPAAARAILAQFAPKAEFAAALLEGTAFEQPARQGLDQLHELLKVLDAGDKERAKEIMKELGKLGGSLEPKFWDLLVLTKAGNHEEPEEKVVRQPHVEVINRGMSDAYANAIARTLTTARSIAEQQFGFDMPDLITITVAADPGCNPSLSTDGHDRLTLNLRSEAALARPARSGWFIIYGLCHEVGHLAMYRLCPQGAASWMSGDAGQGWAHYFGSRVTDLVYAKCGKDLWPDPYDYRADGMQRLEKQLADKSLEAAGENGTAGQWKALVEIVGDKGVAPVFRAWGEADIDPSDPSARIAQTLATQPEARRLAAWWTNAAPVIVQKRRQGN